LFCVWVVWKRIDLTLRLSTGNLEEDETILIGITKSELDIQDSEIRCNVTLPVNGIWDISWCSFLMIDGVERRTPYSAQARIDIRSKAQLSMAERRNGMETLARHFTNEIRCRLHSHKLVGVDDRQKIEASLSSLHWGISKGRDVAEKLLKILRSVAVTSSPVYEALITMLKEANEVQAQLLESVLSYDKRDSRRAFKNSIASKLEHGGSESWMSGVTAEELLELGGDANRLYQLLIEGKKASSLAFDDSTIDAASKREDIFSTKQREELHERKLEVEALLAEEMEKAVKKENEENELKRMETMANRLNLKRGAYVKIQGLEGRSDLNGSLGTYMGVAHGERYTVRIHIVEQDFALKSSKFKEWDLVRDGIPFVNKPTAQTTPWSCGTCTYMHQGSLAHKNHCAMCDTAKGEGSSGTTGGGWNNQATEGKNHPEKAPEKSKLSTKSERLNDIKTPSPPKPDNYNDVATPSQAKPKPENVVNASPAPADQLKAYLHQSNRHCELGIFCADLRRGPEACRFEHLPEEIAVYHPEHPSAIAAAVLDIPLQPSNKAPAQVPKPVVEPQPKKSPAESAQKSSIASGPMDKRAGIRCKYRAACFNLKRGPDKCKHFHTPDEIARYHHTASGPEKMGAHVISSKLQPKPVACCKHGVDCNDLRMGPSKCRFFHPMEEISVYHPNFMTSDAPVSSSAGSQESTSISENKKKDVYRNLLVGADIAPVIVGKGGKRILALRKKSGAKLDINRKVDANGMCTLQISGTAKSVEEAIKLVDEILLDNSKVSSENTQQYVHRNIIVEANTISILIGDGGRLVKSIMNKTGTKITVSRDADSNGCCTISITGGAEAVQMAAKLVVDASLGANGSSGLGSTEDMSLLSELTGDDLIQARPNTVAPTSSEGENGLLAFLLKHKSSLKCSPLQFHKSLKTDDILNLLDLAEACEDEEYTSVLQEYGLKGFKRGPFVKAVHRAAATISS
jgi:transcription antitermination factor NusA-like protein